MRRAALLALVLLAGCAHPWLTFTSPFLTVRAFGSALHPVAVAHAAAAPPACPVLPAPVAPRCPMPSPPSQATLDAATAAHGLIGRCKILADFAATVAAAKKACPN